MNCPSCGVDIDLCLKQQKEWKTRVEKEKEFERIHGKRLQPIKQRRALTGVALGVLIGLLADVLIFGFTFWVFNISFGELMKQLRGNYLFIFFFVFLLLVPIACCALGGFSHGKYTPGKKEEELRKSFGL